MNILHFNSSDIFGGAAIAGYRLHQGLLQQGINSKLLVGDKKTKDQRVAVVQRKRRIETNLFRITNQLGLHYIHLLNSFDIPKHPFYQEADVLNFHNLHGNYFNYLAVSKLTATKPAIFTLHDMWSFTGHCAYSYDCNRWKTGCGKCPYPDAGPAALRDNSNIEWKLKNWVYSHSQLTIVTPSQWLADLTSQSMLGRFPVHCIPNGLDTDAYQPIDPELCRTLLNIAPYKKVLMFAAYNLAELRKGGDLLQAALSSLPVTLRQDLVLLVLGEGGESMAQTMGIQTVSLGILNSDRLKSMAYSAADLFIFPTRADNLPLVLQESMACGTPMVSFALGGVPELVRPGVTGYLAEPENPIDLAKGILELLEDRNLHDSLSLNCRSIAIEEYSLQLQAKRYIELYQSKMST
jgi:glycosyltransferase involved in cell wall biosynthesis